MRILYIIIYCLTVLFSSGCIRAPEITGKLTVCAPHVLKNSLEDITVEFMKKYPRCNVKLKFDMVHQQVRSIIAGKTQPDVFVSVGQKEMAPVKMSGLVAEDTLRQCASVCLVALVPKDNPQDLHDFPDLVSAKVKRIAIPHMNIDSAGAGFRQAMESLNSWDQIKDKVLEVENPHTACEFLEKGEVDAAITYSPCFLFGHARKSLGLMRFIPRHLYNAIYSTAAVLKDTNNTTAAEAYVKFLTDERTQALFEKWGLRRVQTHVASSRKGALLIPCGAGLRPPMDEIGKLFEKRMGTRVDFTYAGAGILLAQLTFSKRGDLYMPGEAFWVKMAQDRGFVTEIKPVAYFVPVIIVGKENPESINKLHDLTRPGLKIGIGEPEALAVGPVTQRILQRAGILEEVEKNVVLKAGCIPELGNAVSLKTVDASIVWDAIAVQYKEHVEAIPIPAEYNEVSPVVIATLRFSKSPEQARRFMEFVASDEAKAIFHKFKYQTERPEGIRLSPQEPPKKKEWTK
ncbi:MAG: molybdate ABC transporter substrate-binding protein [Candidatus Omnitrophica bacterium]|nr:molybdate ABC transporter substrate-binding protein [Candidatus Omnitrophota bacterium]